jgi:predicted PurR-regulated permease PerM
VFILSIAYFILADAGQVPDLLKNIDLPGHMDDLRRLGRELGRIWNAFLRGQLLIFMVISIVFLIMLSILGVRNALGLALLAGLSKFVPYVGPFVARTTAMLVAFFQDGNYFDLEPWIYALVVVVISSLVDQVFDSIVIPRIFGQTLGVHPAAVLVAALVGASLLGFIGLILAAPALASFQMITRYILRKMVDLDPWPDPEPGPVDIDWPFEEQIRKLWQIAIDFIRTRIENVREKRKHSDQDTE